ncbi:Wzz/FepE/Etk N-terminal domain-containing protein [Gammaproteobacteria bacterium]|nr:Wzz/FepE/Etk N-terminal domain-containing protein [Gammaproteobacteria bacterium]
MTDNERDLPQQYLDDELDLTELVNVLLINKLFLVACTGLFSLISIIYSLTLTNIYTAETTLAPTASGNMSSNLSQYAGLASMAGIPLPGSSSGMSDKDLALSLLKSKGLLQRLIDKHDILPDLIAAEAWNLTTNSISYNSDVYDDTKNVWVRNVKPPYKLIPSTQESYNFFDKAIAVSEDKNTGVISLKVDHLSPEIAYQWSLLILQEVNEYVADMRIKEAQLSIDYLNDQIKITPYPELKALFYELIQQHTQSMMLAKVRPEYALTTLDAPLIPEVKSAPKRSLIVILSTLLGGMLGTLIILIRFYAYKLEDPIQLNLSNFR